MLIKKSWTASSKKIMENESKDDLTHLVGSWNTDIDVQISNPYIIKKGPIIRKLSNKITV